MLESIPGKSLTAIRDRAIIATLAYAGPRNGEIRSLSRAEFRDDLLLIRGGAKYGSQRNVSIHPELAPKLLRWLQVAPESPFLFCTLREPLRGEQLSEQQLIRIVRKAARLAGLQRRVYPHLFRHFAITSWDEAGVPLKAISVGAGHASVATTNLYLHADERALADGMKRISL